MVPVALDGLSAGVVVVVRRIAIAVEDGKLEIIHHVGIGLSLDALPNARQLLLQDGFGSGVVGAVGVILDHAQSLLNGWRTSHGGCKRGVGSVGQQGQLKAG